VNIFLLKSGERCFTYLPNRCKLLEARSMKETKKEKSVQKAVPPEITVFANSSLEDVEHAKSFWKSLTLQPPLESRLVSADIRQRLRTAPSPSREASKRQEKDADAFRSEVFLQQARERRNDDERARIRSLAEERESVLNLLQKQRAQRIAKERFSHHFPLTPKGDIDQ